jgi:hypothetical protein
MPQFFPVPPQAKPIHFGSGLFSIETNSGTFVGTRKTNSVSSSLLYGLIGGWNFREEGRSFAGFDFTFSSTVKETPSLIPITGTNAPTDFGAAARLDGLSEGFFQSIGTNGRGDSSYTLATWFKVRDAPSSDRSLVSTFGSTQQAWELYLDSSLEIGFTLADEEGTFVSALSGVILALDTWYLAVVKRDVSDGRVELTLNGNMHEIFAEHPLSNPPATSDTLTVGRNNLNDSYSAIDVACLYLWDRLTTPIEDSILYSAGTGFQLNLERTEQGAIEEVRTEIANTIAALNNLTQRVNVLESGETDYPPIPANYTLEGLDLTSNEILHVFVESGTIDRILVAGATNEYDIFFTVDGSVLANNNWVIVNDGVEISFNFNPTFTEGSTFGVFVGSSTAQFNITIAIILL